jgi:hypothetical protein
MFIFNDFLAEGKGIGLVPRGPSRDYHAKESHWRDILHVKHAAELG